MGNTLKVLRSVFILILFSLLSNCSTSTNENFVLATYRGGEVRLNEYVDHYLLSTKRKPDEMPTEDNLIDIVSEKAISKIAILEAQNRELIDSPNFLKKLNHSQKKILFYRYMRQEIINAVITDSLVRRFYTDYSPQYNMKYILRPFIEKSKQEFIQSQKDTIDFIYEMLQNGYSFAELAKRYSQDMVSNKKGGDIGFLVKESIGDGIIRSVMDTLSDYSYSTPFLGVAGYYILYKGEKREVNIPLFKDVKDRIWQTLYRTRRLYIKEKAKLRFDQLSSHYNYDVHEITIKKISNELKIQPKRDPFKYENLSIDVLNEPVATFIEDTLYIRDIYADKKKRPTDKFDFRLRLNALAQEKLFALHARELDIHKENEVIDELQNIYDSQLRNELYHQEVKIKADNKIELISDEEIKQLSRFELRRLHLDIEKDFRQLLEAEMKEKFKLEINDHQMENALQIALRKKKLQNMEMVSK